MSDPSLAGASCRTKVPRPMKFQWTQASEVSSVHGEKREVRATVRGFVFLKKAKFFQLKKY